MVTNRTEYAFVAGVLIAIVGTAIVTAFAVSAKTGGSHVAAASASPTAWSPPVTTTVLAAQTTPDQIAITVVATGMASGVPDEALVNLGVSATRSNVHDAVAIANDDMSHLLNALHSQDIQDKDIKTMGLSIFQQNNCCPQGAITYGSSNQLAVTIHHMKNVSPVIEAAVAAVGNDIQLNGVSLSVGDDAAMVKAARTAAMSDANARAQTWAALSGHHVGKMLAMSEVVNSQSPNPCNGCGKGGGGGFAIQPGETSVFVSITVVYALLD